tara:strand:- start:827 stop:1855 length:1029 start_codon:yes stop_codon:yes gene_type:complete
MNIIKALLKWLWKWEKGSERRFHGEPTQRYLGASEKSMIDDVRDFLQEIRMQDKLPDILKKRNMSIEEFKRLEGLQRLYLEAERGSVNAQKELERLDLEEGSIRYGLGSGRGTVHEQLQPYHRIRDEVQSDAANFLTSPEQKQKNEEEFSAVENEIIAEQEQISNIQRRWSELAMEDAPQTDERTEALERVRRMMGNARRISNDREMFLRRGGVTPSQTRQMADATQWISRTNEELDSIRSGDYRSWADRTHPSHESIPIDELIDARNMRDSLRERNIRNRFNRISPPRPDPMSMEHNFGSEDEIRFARRMNYENPMGQEEIDNIMRERRRLGLPPYGGEGE